MEDINRHKLFDGEVLAAREDVLVADGVAANRGEGGEPLHHTLWSGDVGVPGLNLNASARLRAGANHVVTVEGGVGNCAQ